MALCFLFIHSSTSCTYSYGGTYNFCGTVWVDINGNKGPNTRGRDFFPFAIKNEGLFPRGCDKPSSALFDNSSQKGHSCTCRVLEEAAINY